MSFKIVHIISGDLWAGAEVMAFSLIKELQNFNECEVSVILFNSGKLFEQIKKLGVPVYYISEEKMSFFIIYLFYKIFVFCMQRYGTDKKRHFLLF